MQIDHKCANSYPRFHRRTAMQITGMGAIATLAGAWLAKSSFAKDAADSQFRDVGFRLFVLNNNDPYLRDTPPEMPRPIWVHTGPRQKASLFIWTTKEQAARIDVVRMAIDATLPPLAEKTPSDVMEVGAPTLSDGKLFVTFCPNVQDDKDASSHTCRSATQNEPAGAEPSLPAYQYESRNQIIAKWNATWKKNGLSIQAVKTTKPEPNVGHAILNAGGQIEIEFVGVLAEDMITAIKDHPQAIRLSWGKPFTVMYCPGCGMG